MDMHCETFVTAAPHRENFVGSKMHFCIPQVLPEFDFSAHKYFPVVKIIWFYSAARADSGVSSQRPSAITNVPTAEQVCNGPDPVHVWTICLIHPTVRSCKGVCHTPNIFFFSFTWMKDVTQETRPENSQLDLNEWQYIHICICVCLLCVSVCLRVWESDTSRGAFE